MEDIFVLINHDMEYQSRALIRAFCDAHDAVLADKPTALLEALERCVAPFQAVTQAFRDSKPNPMSDNYVDQIAWSKSIGMIIPPIADKEFSLSGLQSTVIQVIVHRVEPLHACCVHVRAACACCCTCA